MFQTEINHFFQSFANEWLTTLMKLITDIGYQQFLMFFIVIVLLGIDFRKGFVLCIILLWTGGVSYFLKGYFDLPRPFHVDNTLTLLDGELPDHATFEFSKRGATSFWSGLPEDVVAATRQKELENGLPSGHTSVAIAFWGSVLLLFRRRWITGICIALMILIPISRIYLGVHFLADILAGAILGGGLLLLAYQVILKKEKLDRFMNTRQYKLGGNLHTGFLLITPLIFFVLLPPKVFIIIAFLLGFGLGFLLVAQRGIPMSEAPLRSRVIRTAVGLILLLLTMFLLGQMTDLLKLVDNHWIAFAISLTSAIVLVYLSTELSIKMGWFKRFDNEVKTVE